MKRTLRVVSLVSLRARVARESVRAGHGVRSRKQRLTGAVRESWNSVYVHVLNADGRFDTTTRACTIDGGFSESSARAVRFDVCGLCTVSRKQVRM